MDQGIVLPEEVEEDENKFIEGEFTQFFEKNRDHLKKIKSFVEVLKEFGVERVNTKPNQRREYPNIGYLISDLNSIREANSVYDLRLIVKIKSMLDHGIRNFNYHYMYQKLDIETSARVLSNNIGDFMERLLLHFDKRNINIDYFFMLNMNNDSVRNFFTGNLGSKLTPGNFRVFAVNTPPGNEGVMKDLQDDFFYVGTTYVGGGNVDPYGENEAYRLRRAGNLPIGYAYDPGFRRYSGWRKEQLAQALVDSGILDAKVTEFGNKYGFEFPKLKALGIKNPLPIKQNNPGYYIQKLPRYILEGLYATLVDTTPNWDEVCGTVAKVETIRELAKKELGIEIPGSREEVCQRLSSIQRNIELRSELPSIQQEFLFYPGTKEQPRIQYLKYAPERAYFKEGVSTSRIDIERYFDDIKEVCSNKNKTSADAYQIAINMGIEGYIKEDQPKETMCQIIQRYLDKIREERIL